MPMIDQKRSLRLRYRPSTYINILKILFKSLLHFIARVLPGGFGLRPHLHRLRGVKIAENVWIGDDVYIDDECPETVEIHEGVLIANRCTIIGHTKGEGKIVIEQRAAIGAGSIIVCVSGQTLTIGRGSVISAGSAITSSIPPYTLCGPPRIQVFGTVTVPFPDAETFNEFRRGLMPIRAGNKTNAPSRRRDDAIIET